MREELPIGLCYERCPYCEKEVILHARLGVYKCPECGRWIINCSKCEDMLENDAHCSECGLCLVAEERTKDDERLRKLREEYGKGTDNQ